METIITLEEFHQLVLFQLINYDFPDWARWFSIDNTGEVYIFSNEPVEQTDTYHDILTWTEPPDIETKGWWARDSKGIRVIVTIPNHLSWKDCLWKI